MLTMTLWFILCTYTHIHEGNTLTRKCFTNYRSETISSFLLLSGVKPFLKCFFPLLCQIARIAETMTTFLYVRKKTTYRLRKQSNFSADIKRAFSNYVKYINFCLFLKIFKDSALYFCHHSNLIK